MGWVEQFVSFSVFIERCVAGSGWSLLYVVLCYL